MSVLTRVTNPRRALLIIGAVVIAGCARTNEADERADIVAVNNESALWQMIDALALQLPLSRVGVERVLSTTLGERDIAGNDVFQFWTGGPVALKDGVEIATVDLRIKRVGVHPGFMVLKVSGRCIRVDEIRRRYGDLRITETPRGKSLDETTSHSATLPWGRLSFGFPERNPGCVSVIAFQPNGG